MVNGSQYINSDELYHYGVLGMKWGHRKSSTKVGTNKKSRISKDKEKQIKKNVSKGKKKVDEMRKQKVKTFLKDAAVVTSGALWVASAFIPGNVAGALNGAAAVANVTSVILSDENADYIDR